MYIALKISFGKSSSKRFKEAILLAKKLNYFINNNLYTITLSFKDIFDKWEYVNSLLNIVDKWNSFEICLNNVVCTTNKDYRKLFYEIQEIKTCYNKTKQNDNCCMTTYESGCWRLDSITFDIHSFKSAYNGWYKCGSLIDESTWMINKNKIHEQIIQEAKTKNAYLCPFYSLDKLKDFLETSPNHIDISDTSAWEIEYENILTDKGVELIPKTITYLNSDRFTFNHLKNRPIHGFSIDMNIDNADYIDDKNAIDIDLNFEDLTDEKADILIDRYLKNKNKN